MTILNFLITGLERISDDPGLPRRALLRHPLHRNIPRLPPGEKNLHARQVIQASKIKRGLVVKCLPLSPVSQPSDWTVLRQHGSGRCGCSVTITIIALTIASSSHSSDEFLFEIIPSGSQPRPGQIPGGEEGISIHWVRRGALPVHIYLGRGLPSAPSVFIDFSNPPLTPPLHLHLHSAYKFPPLEANKARLSGGFKRRPSEPDKGHRICKT